MKKIIVAIAQNGAIGKNNDLMWHLSNDLKRFKSITTGHTVVMGKNTFLSLPFRPLKNRHNIVISHTLPLADNYDVVRNFEDAFKLCDLSEDIYIIGGESIYRESLSLVDELIVTWVYQDFEGDRFFPEIDLNEWKVDEATERTLDEPSGLEYNYVRYIRKNS